MWLLPIPDLTGLNSRIFNANVGEMKDAAISYFTTDRLPQKEQKRRIKKYLFDDKTQDEIALEEGVDQAAVCRSINRAKENIKKMLSSGHI